VGYKIGHEHESSHNSRIVYVTVGYLLRLLIHHPDHFDRISHVVLDEVHERGVDNDFLSLLLRDYFESHPQSDIRLVIMSATIQLDVFANYFLPIQADENWAPVDSIPTITLGNKPFPTDILYLDDIPRNLIPPGLVAKYRTQFQKKKVPSSVDTTTIGVVVACKISHVIFSWFSFFFWCVCE